VCAHGGDAASGHPANTREAVLAAAAGGAPCIELDVSVTADGRLVPLHARELGQLLPGRPGAQVDQLVLAEVEALEWCARLAAGFEGPTALRARCRESTDQVSCRMAAPTAMQPGSYNRLKGLPGLLLSLEPFFPFSCPKKECLTTASSEPLGPMDCVSTSAKM